MRDAAVASLGRTTLGIGASDIASRVLTRGLGAERIPFRRAAEDVDQADRITAGFIVTPRGEVRLTARARTRAATLGLVTLAAGGRIGVRHACAVPLVGAAEIVDVADRLAAILIAAGWAVVRNVAARQTDTATLWEIVYAEFARTISAVGIPAGQAAILKLLCCTHAAAAVAIVAAGEVVLVEAVTADGESATSETRSACFENARRVPANIAAIGLEAADRLAARRVVTERSLVGHKAAPRTDVTTAGVVTAGHSCDGDAAFVPTLRAAEWIDIAHARAANLVVTAASLRMRFETTSVARARP